MDVTKLNFFQKQYLTIFKHKSAKGKATVYHELVRFVLEEQCSPTIADLLAAFPNREKSLITDLKYLEEKGMLTKTKIATDFYFLPVLRPFVILKEAKEEVYNYFAESPQYERGVKLKDKINEILDARRKIHQDDWKESFKESGYPADATAPTKENADDYDRGELPPNFDDTENRSGMVVV